MRIGSKDYFDIIFDDQKFTLIADDLTPKDKLKFEDKKNIAIELRNQRKKLVLMMPCEVPMEKHLEKALW